MRKYSITEMKEMHKAVGGEWFNKMSMRFFSTKIEAQPNKNNIFITSEIVNEFEKDCQRKYTLRRFNPTTCHIETIGEFFQYSTRAEAMEARKAL